jgi:hypothetical protein
VAISSHNRVGSDFIKVTGTAQGPDFLGIGLA